MTGQLHGHLVDSHVVNPPYAGFLILIWNMKFQKLLLYNCGLILPISALICERVMSAKSTLVTEGTQGFGLTFRLEDTGTCFEFREKKLFFCPRENKFKQIRIPNKLNCKAFLNMKFQDFQKSGFGFFFLEKQQKIFLHLKQLASTQKKVILKYFQSKYITLHALSSKVVSGEKLTNKKNLEIQASF